MKKETWNVKTAQEAEEAALVIGKEGTFGKSWGRRLKLQNANNARKISIFGGALGNMPFAPFANCNCYT